MNRKVLILGGYGTYGKLIAGELARSHAPITIAGRDASKAQALARTLQADFIRCDVSDREALRSAVKDSYLVVNASGPFQAADYAIPEICIQQGCHYIDLGDGRDYVAGITRLHESAKAQGVFVCAGASTTPAVTSAVVAELVRNLAPIRTIKVALSAGNQNQAGVSTIASILAYVGAPVRVWQNSEWHTQMGWSLGEEVLFPEPVGRRRVQLCDVPDLELFPERFGAGSVVFKAGVELTFFNYAIGGMGRARRLFPGLNLPAFAPALVRLSGLFKSLGTFRGSFAVWITDEAGRERSLAFIARNNGPRIPSAPAVLLARKLLTEGPPAHEAFPCMGYLCLTEFCEYLLPFGITAVQGENGVWA